MKETFHTRWQKLTQSARQLSEEETVPLPYGFTTQLLARFRHDPEAPLDEWLTSLGLRAAITSAVVFAATVSLFLVKLDASALTDQWIESPITTQLLLP